MYIAWNQKENSLKSGGGASILIVAHYFLQLLC